MNHISNNEIPSGWSREEFASASEVLDSMGRAALAAVAGELGITFSAGNESTDEEQLKLALFHDVPKHVLLTRLGLQPSS